MYKLACVKLTGQTVQLWMSDDRHGPRAVSLKNCAVDEVVAALHIAGWEPVAPADSAGRWFRKVDTVARDPESQALVQGDPGAPGSTRCLNR